MKIIVPMAGMGKRLRPHTLTIPKPLIPIAGKPIVERLVSDIVRLCPDQVEEIAFVIGDFGKETENKLIKIAKKLGTKGTIYHQEEALGTAHAILCAKESLEGNVIVAFADTLFKADFQLDTQKDGIIWVQRVADPSAFGVVKMKDNGEITEFVEKPQTFVSDLAIIGIYYFKDGAFLKNELQYLIDNNITIGGEYGLTTALENMTQKGSQFFPGEIEEWLDCGNKNATVNSNSRYLNFLQEREIELIDPSAKITDSVIIPPCYIGKDVEINNSVIGPNVSIGNHTVVKSSIIKETIIQEKSLVENINTNNSMIGNNTVLKDNVQEYSVGDFNTINS